MNVCTNMEPQTGEWVSIDRTLLLFGLGTKTPTPLVPDPQSGNVGIPRFRLQHLTDSVHGWNLVAAGREGGNLVGKLFLGAIVSELPLVDGVGGTSGE